MMPSFFSVLFFSLLLSANEHVLANNLEKDLAEALNSIPEKALTFDYVMRRGIKSSDSYQSIKSESEREKMNQVLSRSGLETVLYTGAHHNLDKREPLTPFAPNRTLVRATQLGARKYNVTGTALSAEVRKESTELNFGGAAPFKIDVNQTVLDFNLSQNLWKDAFGSSTRAGLRAGEANGRAANFSLLEAKEDWFIALSDLFYQAAYFQAQIHSLQKSVTNKERLLQVTGIKVQRGTAETPELLQVKNSFENSKLRLNESKQLLMEIWRGLVLTLNLPEKWLELDPLLIPIKQNSPESEALQLCEQQLNKPEFQTESTLQRLKYQLDSADSEIQKYKGLTRPDTKLNFKLSANGINSSASESSRETYNFDHPAYMVGISLSIPLDSYAEEASLINARINRQKLAALSDKHNSDLKAELTNMCSDLKRLESSFDTLNQMVLSQNKRVNLENDRFRLARIPLFNLIQAEDDLVSTELQRLSTERQKKILSWKIFSLTDRLPHYVEKFEREEASL